MRAFFITAGTVFGLIVAAHAARLVVEPQKSVDPWFLSMTVVSAALSVWAWILVWRSRPIKPSS